MSPSPYAQAGRIFALALMAAILVWPLLAWVKLGGGGLRADLAPACGAAGGAGGPVPLFTGLLPLLAAAYGFYQVARFFGRVAGGLVFTGEAVEALRRFGLALLVAAVLIPLMRAGALAAASAPPAAIGAELLRLAPVVLAGIGAVVLAFARILREAVLIAEENARFV